MQDQFILYSSRVRCRAGGWSTVLSNSISYAQRSGSSFYFSFFCNVSFAFNFLDNCVTHCGNSLICNEWHDSCIVVCVNVLFDKKKILRIDTFDHLISTKHMAGMKYL